jgi:thiamine-phosphate pyrophosphorylase
MVAKDQAMRSQIYLMVEPGLEPDVLGRALDAAPAACVLLRSGAAGEDALRAAIAALRPVAQEREVAFLIENRANLANETGCDGVHLSQDGKAIEAARAAVGANAIVGVYCGDSRHAAMTAAEAGADYAAFGGGSPERWWQEAADPELLAWWQGIMTAPCVAVAGDDLATAGEMAAAGADFVAVGACIWSHPGGPEAAIHELLSMIGNAD